MTRARQSSSIFCPLKRGNIGPTPNWGLLLERELSALAFSRMVMISLAYRVVKAGNENHPENDGIKQLADSQPMDLERAG